ncbi:MAG: metallophosphoesterase family protein [Gammaproteobacteria bacterium]|nr:metallophosphoesterase family protein [Gammaproteobacteria bacterium]
MQFRKYYLVVPLIFLALTALMPIKAESDFRFLPYLQNPSPTGMTILWFSHSKIPGQLFYSKNDFNKELKLVSTPIKATALEYSDWEKKTFIAADQPIPPYKHQIHIDNLTPDTTYNYRVIQAENKFNASFKTAPNNNKPIRFIVYSDSETEPESTGKFSRWDNPETKGKRKYLIDQTQGYSNNLSVIRSRNPDLVLIAGDLVQSGGEQRDWDEFWLQNTKAKGKDSLASNIPMLAALGNHEYFEGPQSDKYNQPGSERAVNKYLEFFEYPANKSAIKEQQGRYYSLQYGPATFIVLDVCNNVPNKSTDDTNFYLLGEGDTGGGFAPAFATGSTQYQWLEKELVKAQQSSLFTFVMFHHGPYSSSPHGVPPGFGKGHDPQSGQAARLLTPVLMQYGVDAVFSGHGEIWERSLVEGFEATDTQKSSHVIHFYDVGTGGDGLRSPMPDIKNPKQQFIAHQGAPEVWKDGLLISGGKHYGHLEVDIFQDSANSWQVVLKPIYIFPQSNDNGETYRAFSRRMYDDQVTLSKIIK